MIQHFYDNNISSLCCNPKDIKERISKLTDENIANIKNLPSIAKYLKTCSKVTNGDDKLSDKEFKVRLQELKGGYQKSCILSITEKYFSINTL